MLATLNDVLPQAREGGYAVPAFDCVEDVMVRAILETAERKRSPVIMMGIESDLKGNGWYYISGLIRAAAEHHDIPVVLHLDHADNLDLIRRAVDRGFTSVMIDGSAEPFEKNVELTAAAGEIARPHGASLEGELGHVGGLELEQTSGGRASILTEPGQVVKFVEQTGVDALAVSIGTSHGVYESEPELNIRRLKELNDASPVPLVLHGGSGTPAPQVREAVKHGICKMNIYADCRVAMFEGLKRSAQLQTRPDPVPYALFGSIKEALADVVTAKIELLGSAGRA